MMLALKVDCDVFKDPEISLPDVVLRKPGRPKREESETPRPPAEAAEAGEMNPCPPTLTLMNPLIACIAPAGP
jgi:hypothetical protein